MSEEGRFAAPSGAEAPADRDVARAYERSGARFEAAGELGRAARSLELALAQWTRLGRSVEAVAVRIALRSLRARGAPIPVGGFDLERQVGAGGMGVVWRGTHGSAPVAIKVLTREMARTARRRESLHSEVRAMAGLDHPNIALVLDCGEVGEAAEAMSDGDLCAGSPYLAMELAAGSLEGHCGRLAWTRCRDILRQVLLGLAHAHARDVVHLDIKPANVLLAPDGRVLVADFGIARAFSETSGAGVAGTPAYMAPEQQLGRWREIGPWTDLYAVGCLALALVQGRAPFDDLPRVAGRTAVPTDGASTRFEVSEFPNGGSTHALVLYAHLWLEPAINPRIDVPAGFEPWARRLLEKAPADRYRWAADALGALDAMEAPAAPVPADWRTAPSPRRGGALLGAGLGLYGVRTVPFVGREPERERMWAALAALREDRQPRALLLHGPPGFGRSRTARWLAVRAHEAGLASWVRVSGGSDTLKRMACALVRADGLGENEISARMEAAWGEPAPRIAALCLGEAMDTAERHALLTVLVERTARERSVIIVIDDAHEDVDALAWIGGALAGAHGPLPENGWGSALIVVTARDDVLAEHPRAARAWEELAAKPGATEIPIAALSPADNRALVRELLGLDPGLAARVEARTAGNPLFAVQLVGDWVQRGLLSPGSGGFELRPGPEPRLPDGLHEVWTARVARVLEGLSAGARDALEIAAVLGRDVDSSEWAAACAAAGVEPGPELVFRLVVNRLVRTTANGWAFEHEMLRESLERMATEGGRRARHHRACAAIVSPDDPGRLGRLLVGAGDAAAALRPLLGGARRAVVAGTELTALLLIDLFEQALPEAAVPEADPVRGEAMILRMLAIGELGRLEEAETLGVRTIAAAREHHWDAVLPEAMRVLARTLRFRARWERAEALFGEAIALFEARGDRVGAAHSRHGLGLLLRRRGDLVGASRTFEQALAGYEESAEPARVSACLQSLAAVYHEAGDFDRALAVYHDLRARQGALGNRLGIADAIVGAAEIARRRGELDVAEAGYREAIELLQSHGPFRRVAPEINLALVLLARDRIDEARAALDELSRRSGQGPRTYRAIVCAAMLVAEAAAPEDAWAAAWRGVELDVLERSEAHSDIAWCAGRAGDRAAEAGYPARARLGWAMAWDQWTQLGRTDEARRVEERLEAFEVH